MRKYLIVFLLGISDIGKSQLKVIAESPVFEEPENGEVLLVNMKDGASAYVRLTAKSGINLRIFDAQHNQTVATKLEPDYGKLKRMSFKGAFETNNELTLLISELEDKQPVLYRLRIDKHNGTLRELKTLATLKPTHIGQGYAVLFGKVPMPNFLVKKDISSDRYAVVRFNSFESERDKRVELIQYAPDGTEKGRVFLSSPGDKYKYTEIFDILVDGDVTYALLFSYNTRSSGGIANELLLATVRDNEVSYTNVGRAIKRRIGSGSLHKNPSTGDLLFVTRELIGEQNGLDKWRKIYALSVNKIDLKSGSVNGAAELHITSLKDKALKIFKDEKDMGLGFEDLIQNHDGSFTVVMEYEKTTYTSPGKVNGDPFKRSALSPARRFPGTDQVTGYARVTVGSSGILTYDADGKEITNALVPKLQILFNVIGRIGVAGSRVLNVGNQFKGGWFVKMKNKSYAFINDKEENEERVRKGKLATIADTKDCEAWQYDLSTQVSAALPIPQRSRIFPPAGKKEKNLMMIGVSQLDYERNTLMTVKVNKSGASIVWLTE